MTGVLLLHELVVRGEYVAFLVVISRWRFRCGVLECCRVQCWLKSDVTRAIVVDMWNPRQGLV